MADTVRHPNRKDFRWAGRLSSSLSALQVGVGSLRLSTEGEGHRVDCRLPCYVYVSVQVEVRLMSLRCLDLEASDDHDLALKALNRLAI